MTVDLITWQTKHGDTVEVYYSPTFEDVAVEDAAGFIDMVEIQKPGWRFRIRAANNKIVEQGSEGYTRKTAAIRAAERHHPRVEAAA